jgi:signal transduction histidine kinase/CheY-like chemotaxis protein
MPTLDANSTRTREAAIDARCVRMSFDALPATAVSTALASAAVAWLLSAEVPMARLQVWVAVVWTISLVRLALFGWLRRRALTDDEVPRALPVFTAVSVAGALSWGVLVLVCQLSTSMLVVTTILLVVGGMMAAGTSSMVGTPRLVVTSAVLSMGPPVVLMVAAGASSQRALLLLAAGHFLTVLSALRMNHRQVRESIALRFENRDLVERLVVEREKELAARRDAERANQDKSRFLAAASHDARQPLHALGLFVDMLGGEALPPPAQRLVSSISLAHGSLVSLHEGLLDLSTLDVGRVVPVPGPVRVRELLATVENESVPRARQRGLTLRVAGADLTLLTDPALTVRILRNLVANALTYTRQGGVLVTARRRGARALLQVWDTGIGIPADQHERIFDELYQVENAARDRAKGLGLGLSIVRRLARSLGSEVTVRSVPGKGSVFSWLLPVVSVADSVLVTPTVRLSVRAGAVALVVDDDGLAREALSATLERWGYEVVAAASAEEALDYARELEQLTLVVSDVWLPGRSGLELVTDLGRSLPGLRRVIITGDTSPATRERAYSVGAGFVLKPVREAALRAVLEAPVAS